MLNSFNLVTQLKTRLDSIIVILVLLLLMTKVTG